MPPHDMPPWTGIALLGLGAALLGYTFRAWQESRGLRPLAKWLWIAIGGVAGIFIATGLRILIVTVVPPAPKPPAHKPVNVANLNNISNAGSDPQLFTGPAGTNRAYFAASGTLLRDGSHAAAPGIRIYRVADGTLQPIADQARSAWPNAMAVLPGAGAGDPDTVVFAEEDDLWRHDGTGYAKIEPKTGTGAVGAVHELCAAGSECVMLASPSAGSVALYRVDAAAPEYELVAGSIQTAGAVLDLGVSDPGDASQLWRRATYVLVNGAIRQLYRWDGSGAPVPVDVAGMRRAHSGTKALLASGVIQLAATTIRTVQRIDSGGSVTALPCQGSPTYLDAIHGMQSWQGESWVLGRRGANTYLWQVVGDELVAKLDLGDLGTLPAGDAKAPRGFVPLSASLGFLSSENTFWSATPSGKYTAPMPEIGPVESLWSAGGIAYFAAGPTGPSGTSVDVEPWTWDSH